jgi:Cys-rich repeat protein
VVCAADADCAAGQLCDLAVPGGACVTCTATDGCDGATPVCDPSVAGGACVECTADDHCPDSMRCDEPSRRCVTCTADGEGCAPPAPYCDVAADGDRGACVGCRSDLDCGAGAPACDPARRICVGCADDDDCGGSTPRCDAAASGGLGVCVACLDRDDCDGATPICDRRADGGRGACVACTAEEGCPTGRFCDGNACLVCSDARGCAGATPYCDTSVPGGACRTCLDDDACTADPSRPLCDPTQGGGRGACVACAADGRGCGGETPFCVVGANWGAGLCQRCTPTEGCSGETPFCDTSRYLGACVSCTATQGCGGATPICNVTAAGGLGACVRCVSNADCGSPTPTCDSATHTCVGCVTSADCPTSYFGVCDTTGQRCVACTPTEGCGGYRPFCVTGPYSTRCAECRDADDCETEVEGCLSDTCRNLGTLSIDQVRHSRGTTISVATVTFLKPPVDAEPAGFFLQGERYDPAIFVAIAPSALTPPPAVGDRVSFEVTSKTMVQGMLQITRLSNWQLVSRGHSVDSIVEDIGLDANFPTYATSLESALVTFTARLDAFATRRDGSFACAGLQTETWGPTSDVEFCVPAALQVELDLASNCTVSVAAIPMWLVAPVGLPTAYARSDFASITCPAPNFVGATAPSPTQVVLAFDRVLDRATVLADGTQFAVTPSLAVVAAAVAGKTITLTTAPQAAGTSYTVAVAGTVRDLFGAAVAPPAAASFPGAP